MSDRRIVGLDPVIHAEARLRVVSTLAALCPGDQISFPRLQKVLGMTAGNLSTHNRKLEEAGYLELTKTIEGRQPVTYLALTDAGRAAFAAYRAALVALLAPDQAAPDQATPGQTTPGQTNPDPTSHADHPSGLTP